MHEIAILIPTYGRAHKLAGIKANIEATCKQNIYIIINIVIFVHFVQN